MAVVGLKILVLKDPRFTFAENFVSDASSSQQELATRRSYIVGCMAPQSSILNLVAKNRMPDACEMMRLFLEARVDGDVLSLAIENAARNITHGGFMLNLLLNHYDGEMTQETLLAASNNGDFGSHVWKVLINLVQDLQVSQEVVITASKNRSAGHEILTLLLRRFGIPKSRRQRSYSQPETGKMQWKQ